LGYNYDEVIQPHVPVFGFDLYSHAFSNHMTQRQSIINVICASLFCWGLAAAVTGTQQASVWLGIGWLFASISIAIVNNIKIKE
jgi:hypothetical protein